MRLFAEVFVSIVLHPVAMFLAWVDIVRRPDLTPPHKAPWIVLCGLWGIGPLLYIAGGRGKLW